jgi:glycyl-tRNA synthetase beta subunit
MNEWMKKMWHTYTVQYYSPIKNKIMLFAGKYVELEIILLSEVSHTHRDKYGTFSLMWYLE